MDRLKYRIWYYVQLLSFEKIYVYFQDGENKVYSIENEE